MFPSTNHPGGETACQADETLWRVHVYCAMHVQSQEIFGNSPMTDPAINLGCQPTLRIAGKSFTG
jgi:hypothetical protein